MEYITIKEASDKWGLSVRRVQSLCSEDQIDGAIRFSGVWAIPSMAQKPVDHRIKSGKYIKSKVLSGLSGYCQLHGQFRRINIL